MGYSLQSPRKTTMIKKLQKEDTLLKYVIQYYKKVDFKQL